MTEFDSALRQFILGWPLMAAIMVGLSMTKSLYDEWNDEASGRVGQAAVVVVGIGMLAIAYWLGGTSLV